MQLDGAAEVALSQAEIAVAEVLLAEAAVVILVGRRLGRGRRQAPGRDRIVLRRAGLTGFGLGLKEIAEPSRSLAAVEPQQARDGGDEDSRSFRSHGRVPPAACNCAPRRNHATAATPIRIPSYRAMVKNPSPPARDQL